MPLQSSSMPRILIQLFFSYCLIALSSACLAKGLPNETNVVSLFDQAKAAYGRAGLEILPNTAQDKAVIYVYRKRKLLGAAVKHSLVFNNSVELPIRNKGCSAALVEPGQLTVKWVWPRLWLSAYDDGSRISIDSSKGKLSSPGFELSRVPTFLMLVQLANNRKWYNPTVSAPGIKNLVLTIDVKPGESYFMRFGVNEGDSSNPHPVFLVSKAEALDAAAKCKYKDPTYLPAGTEM